MYQRRWDQQAVTLSPDFTFRTIDQIGWYAGLMASPGGWFGVEFEGIRIGNRSYTGDDFLALISLIASDGWTSGSENTKGQNSFCCFREDRLPMVREFAGRMGFHELPSRPGVWTWIDHDLAAWLRANLYTGDVLRSPFKRVPDIVKVANEHQIKHFLRFFGDQHENQFYTSSRRMLDDLQELHLRLGKRTGIYERPPRNTTMADGRMIRADHCAADLTLTAWEQNLLSIDRKKQIYTEEYAGPVFCATVPNSTLITRRNGTVLISGNSCNSYGTKDGAATSLKKAGKPLPGYFAALPLYRGVRCLERAQSTSGALPPLTDCGAGPDDVLTFAQQFGIQTSVQECGETGPSDKLSQYEDAHVNDEPTLGEFEHDSSFRLVGGFDITSTGDQRLLDVSNALAAGYAVGISVYAADQRFQGYDGGITPDPPAGVGCDHWNYLVGASLSFPGYPIVGVGVNSWTDQWGTSWGHSPSAGLWLGGPGIIQAADCLIVYAVSETTP